MADIVTTFLMDLLDTVEGGVTAFEDFFARILTPLEAVLGSGDPLAAGLAKGLALLQQDVAEVKLVIAGVESPFVFTAHVYNSVVGYIEGLAGAYKGLALTDIIKSVIADAGKGIPVVLDVLGGASAYVKVSEQVLAILVPLVLAAI
jgi:hypothetical protein